MVQQKMKLSLDLILLVALTASVFEEEKAVVLSTGCDSFIRKPFREAEIFDAMEKQIGVQFIYETDENNEQKKQKLTCIK